jgi:hypothetical protein
VRPFGEVQQRDPDRCIFKQPWNALEPSRSLLAAPDGVNPVEKITSGIPEIHNVGTARYRLDVTGS